MANRFLNNIRINDAYTFPDDDGTVGQAILTDGAGNLSFGTVASGEADSALKIVLTVKNVSSGTLTAGTVVRAATTSSPPSGNVLEVNVADNSAASTMPAVGILIEDITAGSEGECVAFGRASGFSTSGFTEGDTLYVNTSGGFTTTKPTGAALIQRIGQVIKVHASNGSIEVFGAGRANDVPNIPQDQLWLGNSSGVATPTDHTVENISNVTVSSKIGGQALVWDAANSYWKNGDVASGGANVTVQKNVYTANGSTTAFNTSTSIVTKNNLQVYIDGVYQSKDNYTTSGSTVTFSTAPPNATSLELIHMVAVDGVIARDDFTGDGSTTAFVLSMSITNENATQVYIGGIYQSKDNYTTSGSTLTFSTAPLNNAAIEVINIKAVDATSLNQNSFTGNGSTTAFTLSQSVDDENKTFVFIQGIYQEKSTYSIAGNTITFLTAPQNGYTVEVMAFNTITVGNPPVTSVNGQTGAVTINVPVTSVNGQTGAVTISTGYSVSVISSNTTAVANTLYVLTATLTLTLPASPTAGDSVKISNRSGVATAIIARNSENIMGAASDLTLDKLNTGFELIYSNSAQGWILIGVEGTAA